jgi:ABC-type multidrug transport system fused ATPase/permease subunit
MHPASPSATDPSKPKTAKPSGMIRLLWPYLRPHAWKIILSLTLNAVHGLAITYQMLVAKYLIDDVIRKEGLDSAMRWSALLRLALTYLVVSLIGRMAVWHIGYRIFTRVREAVLLELRSHFFRHVNHLCLRFHIKHNSGELFSYLFGSPLAQLQGFLQQFTISGPGAIITVCSTLALTGAWDPVLAAVLLLLCGINVVLMHVSRRRIQTLYSDYQKVESTVSGYVADLLRGSRHVKIYAMESHISEVFEDQARMIGQMSVRRDIHTHYQYMKAESAGYFCFALLCAALLWRYENGRISLGEITGYIMAFTTLQGPLGILFSLATAKGSADASVQRIRAVLDTASTTPDPVQYEAQMPRRGDIVMTHVSFAYEPGQPVLRDISLTIPHGQKVALVGPSGAGKSTITQLLMRLYDPDQGTIRIGGVDIRHCVGADLRRHFGVVPQDPFIFRSTLRENLLVVQPQATTEHLRRACELANAWEFIAPLPLQLDTPVGEGGATLSGGQRQRLAIARALLSDSDFFIFDEATSALDTVSEAMIQQSLEKIMVNHTSLIIAHRLATVKHCDRILVLKDGLIVQDGTYDELLSQPGTFQQLVQGQALRH